MNLLKIDRSQKLIYHQKLIAQRNKLFDKSSLPHCAGCGSTWPLSRAHIIRVGYRKDLEMDVMNMAYLCMSTVDKVGCHNIWDDGTLEDKKKLNCFSRFMDYIYSKDINLYNRIIDK
jgi:hypothetical protein